MPKQQKSTLLCIPDTNSLIHMRDIDVANKKLWLWLWEEFDVRLSEAICNELHDHSELTEAVEYVSEIINHHQYRDEPLPKELPQTYPFEPKALEMLLDGLEIKTPREINKRCRNVINFAFRDNRFPRDGEGIIDPTYVKTIENSELDREIV